MNIFRIILIFLGVITIQICFSSVDAKITPTDGVIKENISTTYRLTKGEVVYEGGFSCDYAVVKYGTSYIVVEWKFGSEPSKGDEIVAEFSSIGSIDYYNISDDSNGSLYVESSVFSLGEGKKIVDEKCE